MSHQYDTFYQRAYRFYEDVFQFLKSLFKEHYDEVLHIKNPTTSAVLFLRDFERRKKRTILLTPENSDKLFGTSISGPRQLELNLEAKLKTNAK